MTAQDAAGPLVVLVGPPGAGKSSVGALLAKRRGVDVTDTDEIVEAEAGKAVADIFVDDGEQAFRTLESAAVAAALSSVSGVLSLGGGAIVDEQTRLAVAGHRVVFLDVGLAEASSRVGLGTTRPLLLGNVRGQLKALLDARRPLYAEVATLTVVTDGLTIDEVADQIERWLDE